MRLLHVVPTYLPAVRYGGPIESVHGLCKALVALGHEVHVYTTSVDGAGDSAVPLDCEVALEGVRVRYFPSRLLRRLFWSPPLGHALARDAGGFDAIHTHSVFLWPTWKAARCAQRAGVPYVLSPRGMLVKDLVRRRSPLAKGMWLGAIERGNLERAAAVHVTSEAEAVQLAAFGFRLARLATIPNGVDVPPLAEPAERDGSLLFLGRLSWKKGLDRLIESMARLPEARLTIAGNDEEGIVPDLTALAARSGVSARIRFIGPVYGAQKWELYRRAGCFVLPSHSENFGNAALEAMAAACPVVVTPGVGLAGAIAAAGAGIVANADPASLATAIGSVLGDRAAGDAMGRAGEQMARRQFGWDGVARQMASLYASVATNV